MPRRWRLGGFDGPNNREMIDTLKLSKGLQQSGMSSAQADVIAEALNDAQGDYLTKQDLQIVKSDLERQIDALELRLVKMINDSKNQTLLAIGLLVLAQIGLHFWH